MDRSPPDPPMATLKVEVPDRLAAKLAAEAGVQQHLEAFLIGAVEAWLRRQGAAGGESSSWSGAFEASAVDFVDQLVDENHELFEELAGR